MSYEFEWDPAKADANLAKHGVDFETAKLIFASPSLEFPDARYDYGEARIGAYGIASRTIFFVVYTNRGSVRRLISARKAGTDEREFYLTRITQGAADR